MNMAQIILAYYQRLRKYTSGSNFLLQEAQRKGRSLTDAAAEIIERDKLNKQAWISNNNNLNNSFNGDNIDDNLENDDNDDNYGTAKIDSWISIREALKIQIGWVHIE